MPVGKKGKTAAKAKKKTRTSKTAGKSSADGSPSHAEVRFSADISSLLTLVPRATSEVAENLMTWDTKACR
jgi:hypothetical protein